MTDLKNNLEEVLEVNPMNNKKYIEAVSFRDWQTCDLICDEHSVLVGRINSLEQELQKTEAQLCGCRDRVASLKKEIDDKIDSYLELNKELQKTREQLEEKDKEIEEYRLNAIGKMNLEIAHENSELREQLIESNELLIDVRDIFQDKIFLLNINDSCFSRLRRWNNDSQKYIDKYFKDKDKQGE